MRYNTIHQFARLLRNNQTKAEKQFWSKVRKRQILNHRFIRQYIIQHSEVLNKKHYFITDFFCFEKKLIVEIDGKVHDLQLEYDKIRESILLEMGYRIIRFKNEDVLNNWKIVLIQLKKALH